jgi:hypothetical protein
MLDKVVKRSSLLQWSWKKTFSKKGFNPKWQMLDKAVKRSSLLQWRWKKTFQQERAIILSGKCLTRLSNVLAYFSEDEKPFSKREP